LERAVTVAQEDSDGAVSVRHQQIGLAVAVYVRNRY
jgi:hypothetical protein